MPGKPMRNRFNIKKALIVTGAAILFILLAFLGFLILNPAYKESPSAVTFVKDNVARQQKIESEIRAYYKAGKYTFSAPLVLQDPYQVGSIDRPGDL